MIFYEPETTCTSTLPSTRAQAVIRVVKIGAWMLGWAMLVWGR